MPHKIQDKPTPDAVKEYLGELQERRKKRLNGLIASVGGQTLAIERLGKSQSLLSQLSTGRKPIGETLARDIEYAAKKPLGWLDWDDAEERLVQKSLPQDSLAKELWAMWAKLTVGDKRELIGRAAGWLQRREDASAEDYQRA